MRRTLLALLTLAVLFGGCERRETPQPQPPKLPPKRVSDAPRDGGRLVRRLELDVRTLNFVLHTEEEERQVLALIYDPLIAFDQNLDPMPGLATKWEVGDGDKSYTLHLDKRATFSDGKPVRASDVVFTINKIVDDESMQFSGWFEGLDRAQTKAIDDHTVRVAFKEARVTQLPALAIGVMPEHVYGKGELSKNQQVIGTGPYVLKKRDRGRSIELERREDYWRQKPHIKTILFRVVGDDKVAWNSLMRGELDVARVNNELWAREKDKPEVQKRLAFFDTWMLSYNFIAWNLDDPRFNDARVRRALAMSFDRNAVIEKLYHGQARPVSGPFVPDQWAHNDKVVPIEFNPQAAAALLASAGWADSDKDGILDRNGRKFTFTLLVPSESGSARDQALVLQDALLKLGVKLEIGAMDAASFFDRVLNRNFEAAFMAWFNEPDPDPYTMFHSKQKPPAGLNVGSYASDEADELIERGRRELDRAQRAEIYHQLHEVLARDQPYLWTVQVAFKWAVNRRVQNVRSSKGLGLFLWYPGPYSWWLRE